MTKINVHIPDELIAMSQRNPFRDKNGSQGALEGTKEVVTIALIIVKLAAASAAAASGGPSSLKSSKL